MFADLRFALRLFARSPLFTAAVVLVLGLGIGATTTVFSLVDAYLVKPLPFYEPDRLVVAWRTQRPSVERRSFSQPDFLDLKERATSFSRLAIVGASEFSLGTSLEPRGREVPAENLLGSRVSADFFPLLGVSPALGRAFSADEDTPGRGQVVVLSDALWRRRFEADPSVIGKTIALDGKPHQIVGVMPASFRLPAHLKTADAPDFWLPAALTRENAMGRDSHKTTLGHVIGRLAPGVSFEAADAEVRAIAARLEQAYPETNTSKAFFLVGLHEHLASRIKPALTLLSTATALLLVIASANVALLLLARATAREGEAAVRAALGASRSQLMRQFFVESTLLALFGGLAGFALAVAGTQGMAVAYQGSGISPHEARPDARVFAFAVLAALLVGLGCGVASALRVSGVRLYGLLKEGATRSTAGFGHRRLQATLLAAEVALSAVLLAASTAVAHGFYDTMRAPLGFATEGALTFSVRLTSDRYPDAEAVNRFHQAALGRLRALPSASSVGVADYLPLSNIFISGTFEFEGKQPQAKGEEPSSMVQHVDAGYFRSLGVPLVRGRAFADGDGPQSGPVVVVSESFARHFLPGEDPIGKRVRQTNRSGEPWREIVGVVGDLRFSPWEAENADISYVPSRQEIGVPLQNRSSFVIRTQGSPRALANAAREAIAQIDADLPVFELKTFDESASEALADRRFTLALVSCFAGSALALTALGLFGLVSYQTKRRSRELAIRMALGAASTDVERLVLRDTSRLLAAGLALGLPAAFVAGRLIVSELEGVPPIDPLTLASTALVLGLVALAAVLAPARRAARTPPALVLRGE